MNEKQLQATLEEIRRSRAEQARESEHEHNLRALAFRARIAIRDAERQLTRLLG